MKNRRFLKRLTRLSLLYSLILFVMPFFSLPSINVPLLQTQQQPFLLLQLTQDAIAQIQTTETTENDFLTYQNSTYGINIQYPRTWNVIDNLSITPDQRNIDIVQFYDPNSTAFVSISTDSISQTQDKNVYLAEIIQAYRKDPTFTVIKTTTNDSMLADQPGYELLYTSSSNDTRSVVLSDEIAVLFTEVVVYITYSADVIEYAVYRPIADQMINSLKIDISQTNETQDFMSNSLGQLLQQGLTGEI
jgi:hypothetical protein